MTTSESVPTADTALAETLRALRCDLEPRSSEDDGAWRWRVRRRLAGVRDALQAEAQMSSEGWLAARSEARHREREPLLRRVAGLGDRALDAPAGELRTALVRLAGDLDHHDQRRRDLAYDAVEMELGGSE